MSRKKDSESDTQKKLSIFESVFTSRASDDKDPRSAAAMEKWLSRILSGELKQEEWLGEEILSLEHFARKHSSEHFACVLELLDVLEAGHVSDDEVSDVARRLRLVPVGHRLEELRRWSRETAPARAARWVLHVAGKKGDELAKAQTERAFHLLRGELEAELSTIEEKLSGIERGTAEADTALATIIEGYGKKAHETAKALREEKSDEERRNLWDTHARPHRPLAWALWQCRVRVRLEREESRIDTAGLVFPVLNSLTAAAHRGAQMNLLEGATEIIDKNRRRVGALREAQRLNEAAPHLDARHVSLASLGKLSTQRVIRWALWEGYRRKWIDDEPEPSRIFVTGGYSELARLVGMKGKKAAEEVRDATATLDALYLDGPLGEGRVFSCFRHTDPTHKGQQSVLEITLHGPFTPDYIVRKLGKHRSTNKWLIPVPMPQLLPPLVGRPNEHAAQAILQVLALREFRANAAEFVEEGNVEILESRWRELAEEAGLPRRILPDVLKAYPVGDDEGRPPFLERPHEWRFTLTEPYHAEKRSILNAGQSKLSGRESGLISAAKRRNGGVWRKRSPAK